MSKIEVNAIEPQCGTDLTVGASGDTITFPTGTTVVNNGTQTGFGRTGTVNWDTTPKTATFSAVNGNGYFVNTTAGVITVNLPAGVAGNIISVADYAATWQTNNVTVTPNGTDKIGSINQSATLSTEGQSVTLVYVDATQGWINTMDSTSNVRGIPPYIAATGGTITTVCTDYKVHTFTGPGTFTVTNAGTPSGSNSIEYLVIAGGAGGGGEEGGGGGAGGYRTASGLPVTAQGYPIVVGGGGAGMTSASPAANGVDSSGFAITSTGGGFGGGQTVPYVGRPGGSGGGGHGDGGGSPQVGGTGNTPPVSPSQGFDGGDGSGRTGTTNEAGGGGGGAGAIGSNGSPSPNPGGTGGPGGAGAVSSINGTPTTRAGGGGGAAAASSGVIGTGGSGGGGNGTKDNTTAVAGTVNTGSGGGGGGGNGGAPIASGGAGGSGIVIIRYKFQ